MCIVSTYTGTFYRKKKYGNWWKQVAESIQGTTTTAAAAAGSGMAKDVFKIGEKSYSNHLPIQN